MVDEIVQMTKLLRNNPLAAKARLRRATLYRQLGLLESAEADLIQLVAKAPSAEAYYQLALVHKQRRHDCEAAIKMLSKAVSLKPQYADALFERGNLLKIVGRDDAAILDRTEAIRLKPELASEFAHDMSDASIPDDWETRVMNLNARIKKRSDDLTLRTQLANLYLEIGDYERGFRCLDELLVLAPNNDSVLYSKGMALVRTERLDEGIRFLAQSYRIQPTATKAHALAQVYLQKSDLNNFGIWAKKAAAIEPDVAERWNTLAFYYSQVNKPSEAVNCANRAIKTDPNNATSFVVRGMARIKAGQFDSAIADMNAALELNPHLLPAKLWRGTAYAMSNKNSLALKDFDSVIRDRPTDYTALTNRGVLHMNNRNRYQASLDFERALAIKPDHEVAKQNLSKLQSD